MAAFQFPLKSVLRFREQVRDEKRWELGSLAKAFENLTSEIDGLEQLLSQKSKEWAGQQHRIFLVTDLKIHTDYCQGLVYSMREKREALVNLQGKMAEKREEVIVADQGVKGLERLRDRLLARHLLQENREEQKLVDELGQRRHTEREDPMK